MLILIVIGRMIMRVDDRDRVAKPKWSQVISISEMICFFAIVNFKMLI